MRSKQRVAPPAILSCSKASDKIVDILIHLFVIIYLSIYVICRNISAFVLSC